MEFKHISVMLDEVIDYLDIKPDGIYVDGTLGGAGHSFHIAERLKDGRLIGIDQDSDAIKAASERLSVYADKVSIVKSNFKYVSDVLKGLEVNGIDGALLDLGVSSYQLDEAERGFSYMADAPLDMRMDREGAKSAYDIVNTYSVEELTKILYDYSEERWAKRIAEFICERRQASPIKTTGELVDIVRAAIPKAARLEGGHPAKRTFQAIRIEVNGELSILRQAVLDFADALNPGGRLCIITFHSLEDRIVKEVFEELCTGCTCPKEFPVCVCGKKPQAKKVTRKPVVATKEELEYNSRSKSAKLRVIEKL